MKSLLNQGPRMRPPRVEVVSSITKILMHSSLSGRNKKRLKLINQSKVTAKFMFDIVPRQCIIFQPDIIAGTIRPNCHVNITITFSPIEKKIYYFPLICLILHGAPIIIEVYGHCEIPLIQQDDITLESVFDMGLTTFEKYFNDNSRIKRSHQTPALSLSQNYLVFEKSSTLNPCQTSSVTNHTPYELFLEWEKDVDGIFTINPQSLQISGGKSGHFRVSFEPQRGRGKWCVRDLAAHGTINSPEIKHVFTLIRVMGYSLSNEIQWRNKHIRNKKRMEKLVNDGRNIITLPPCTPGSSSYTTFLIRNDNADPLTFQFIPPYSDYSISTQFNIKPMLGVVYEKYQIVAVEMFPDAMDGQLYSERWSIKFNENSDNQSFIYITFQGLAECPKICVGNNDNEISFSSVHPGCNTVQSVFIKNLTRHSIRYVFSHLPLYIISNKLSDDIHDHEIHSLDWTFCPSQPGLYECNILCSITALGEFAGMGKPIEMRVHITAMSAIGLLKAEPDELNFTEIPYNELRKFNFHVFNSSDVEMYFKLMSKPVTGERCCEEFSKFQMHPTSGRLLPTERQEIIVSLLPRRAGFFKVFIMYSDRESLISICTITYTCILPTIRIIDMQYHHVNPNFGKLTLWRLFKINLLNKIIEEMEPNMEKTIDIYVPQIAMNNDSSIVKFLVKNVSSVPAFWCVKKKLMRFTSKNINEKLRTIHPESGIVQPKDIVVVTIELSREIHCERCQWYISLGQNRRVLMAIDHTSSFLYGPNFILDNVYLGDPHPRYQVLWLYNPTSDDLIFSIDTEAFNVINAYHRSVALTCVQSIGSIPPQMLHPILVKFQPRRLGRFTILIPIIVGETETSLMMEGGTSLIHQQMKIPHELPYLRETFYIPEIPVYISSDIIILPHTSLCGRVTCTITLSNRSDSEVFGYEWKHYKIIDVIYLSVIPQKGRIQPLAMHSFELIVETGNKPCQIDANIACQLINYTAKRIYWRSIDSYNRKIAEIKEQFTITKGGIYFPVAEYQNNVPNPPLPFHRVLTVCCMTSSDVKNDDNNSLKDTTVNNLPAEILNIASEVLAKIIWNILHSEMLEYIIHSKLK